MTTQIETAITAQTPSRWQRLLAWLTAFEEAMDYDPQQEASASIKRLNAEVERLSARLDEAEGGSARAA